MRPLSFWIGTALFSLGVVVLLVVGGIYAYSFYQDRQAEQDYQTAIETETALAGLQASLATPVPPTVPPTPDARLLETPVPTGTAEPSATPAATGTPTPRQSPQAGTPPPANTAATVSPTLVATGAPALVATAGTLIDNPQLATRIRIPSIKLDAPVAESVIKNGLWTVPKFAAGHLQGTAYPGGPGNAAYAGHVSSISSGNVFANIGKTNLGDDVIMVTKTGEILYRVSEKSVVKNTDLSVIQDFGDQRVTLITCTGTWLPLQRDYSQRLIVVATRVG